MDDNKKLTFSKHERIYWKRHLDLLFTEGLSFVAYPLRIIYLPVKRDYSEATTSVVVSVPKKKFKHATDRNVLKRRIRESYRLRKHELIDFFSKKESALFVAFIYLNKDEASFETIDKAMIKAIRLLMQKHE